MAQDKLLNLAALLLDESDREIILGDLEQLGSSPLSGIWQILGLFARRQHEAWTSWRPWLALCGVSLLSGIALSGLMARLASEVSIQLATYRKYGVRFETGLSATEDFSSLSLLAVLLVLLFWIYGYVLARLSGRTAWLTGLVLYVTLQESWFIEMLLAGHVMLTQPLALTLWLRLLPLNPVVLTLVCVTLAGAAGPRKATSSAWPHSRHLVITAVFLICGFGALDLWNAHELYQWSGGMLGSDRQMRAFVSLLIAGLPIALLPLAAQRRSSLPNL